MATSPDTDVVVIGAGCAGLSAGVRLASRGLKVTVLEEAPRLGGRASSFTDPGSGQRLDNGQHALFGCYRETYNFLRVIGTSDLAPLDSTLRLAMADVHGRSSTLLCPQWRSPLHLVAGVMGWDAVPLRDRLATGRVGGLLWSARRDGAEAVAARVPAHLTVTQWLREYSQPASLCDWLWNPLALAALNQDPDIAAAQPFVRVLAELFGPWPSASSLGVPSVPLDELYAEPAARFIEAHGGAVRRRVSARVDLDPSGGRHRVVAGDDILTPRAVISAVPWHAFGRLWTAGAPAPLAAIDSAAAAVQSAPIVTVNLWFDRPVLTERQLGLIGTQFHWAFPKKTSGVFSIEKDTRRLFPKRQEGAGSSTLVRSGPEKDTRRLFLVTVVASGAEGLLRQGNDELAALAERELRACVPGAAGAVCVRALVVREARATFSLAPGAPVRPRTETPVPGFFLA
ncbi:MAG: hydroxysqualene dehydroxylase HpnE, partial [Acidobacteria bacterium]|nr:hydroxysqualene dehydroxylase HpnE [Acidobacteriota bacterium]